MEYLQHRRHRFSSEHRNLKYGNRIKPHKVKKIGEKVPKAPKNCACIKYCAMENCGGKIYFMI
jgi:hypothetical protein